MGEAVDGINAAWYSAEGDYLNAGLSAAAMVPILGWGATGGKIFTRGVRTAERRTVRPATSAVSGRDLARSLASESQMAGPGTAIIGAGTSRPLRSAERLAVEYGGEAQDWAKICNRIVDPIAGVTALWSGRSEYGDPYHVLPELIELVDEWESDISGRPAITHRIRAIACAIAER